MPTEFLSSADEFRLTRFPDDLDPQDLNTYFYLTDTDLKLLNTLRGDENRLGVSVLIGSLRFLGFFPELSSTPSRVLEFLAQQLDCDAKVFAEYGARPRTLRSHQQQIMAHLGYRRASPLDLLELEDWLLQRALEHDDSKTLFEQACQHIHRLKIMRLGISRIEKLIGTARRRAVDETYKRLGDFLTTERREQLDRVLRSTEEAYARLHWFQRTPKSNKPQAIITTLKKIHTLKDMGVMTWDLSAINPNRLKWLAQRGSKMKSQGLREMQPTSRYPILAAFLQQRLYLFTDAVVEMVNQRLWDIHNECKRAFEDDRLAATKTINETLSALKVLGSILLDETVDDSTVREQAFQKLSVNDLNKALERADQLIRPEKDAYVDYFSKRYRSVQNISKPLLATMDFVAADKDQGLLKGLGLVDEIHQGQRRKLPASTPTSFIPNAWWDEIIEDDCLDWRSYEIAALWVLREKLRSGDVYVSHSRRYLEMETYFIPKPKWLANRHEVVELTGTTLNARARLAQKTTDLLAAAERLETRLGSSQDFIRIQNDVLILSPLKAEEVSPELAWLRKEMDKRLPPRDITNVLIDMDNACNYSDGLLHLQSSQRRDKDLLQHLYGCLLAQACNLGFKQMSKAADLSYNRLLWCNRWFIREDTLEEANAKLVQYQVSLPYSELWGTGLLSSSDGQRFPVKGDNRRARAQPNYFGYGIGVTFYTWALDTFAQFGSKAIPSTTRDATYVLDGILNNHNEIEVLEHSSDTAGYTEVVFALFDLLGMTFSPRIKDLANQQLYRLPDMDMSDLSKLRSHLSGVTNDELIVSGWDEMLRLVLSLKKGYVTSSLIIQKLQAYPRKHPLMRMLQEYGRIIKTIHILNWYENHSFRRRISLQLNKGEALHLLRAAIFYGKHGELVSMEDEPLDHIVGCLNLVSSIVVVWNTGQMAKVIDDLKAEGHQFKDEDVARLWPTRHQHINIIGRYHFATDEILVADD